MLYAIGTPSLLNYENKGINLNKNTVNNNRRILLDITTEKTLKNNIKSNTVLRLKKNIQFTSSTKEYSAIYIENKNNLRIEGVGAKKITLRGEGKFNGISGLHRYEYRIFYIKNSKVTLKNLKITNGYLEDNSITGSDDYHSGGGIYIDGGTVTMTSCEVSGNTAVRISF